jgi:hypothetical protein
MAECRCREIGPRRAQVATLQRTQHATRRFHKLRSPGNEGPDPGSVRHPAHLDQRPYWKRAHRDWRIWVALVAMLAAITIYILSEDLAFLPHG